MQVEQVVCRILCKFCGKSFSKKCYLNRHLRNIHNRNARGELIPEEKIKKRVFSCVLCNKQYTTKYSLDYHTKGVHLREESEKYKCSFCDFSSIFKTNTQRHEQKIHLDASKLKKNAEKTLECSLCSAKFRFFRSLRCHERIKHRLLKKPAFEVRRKCPICSFISSGKETRIYNHFESAHGIPLKWITYRFNSSADFYKWKLEIERKTTSSFTKTYTGKTATTYRCHRSGKFIPRGTNKRKVKRSGSCKINAFCPAAIKVKRKEDILEVCYQAAHIGHINEVKHKKLSSEEKKAVKNQICGEVQLEDDLNIVSVSIAKDDLRLMYLAKKEDISNIEQNLNFDEEIKNCPINPEKIQSWIDSVKSSNDTALLFFKPHGAIYNSSPFFNKECFIIVFMTKAQKSLLQKYGCDTVILHQTYSSDIRMCSLLILDESREAFPTAFMFTDKIDENTLPLFLEKVKCAAGEIKPKVFISDTNNLSYVSWVKVMGIPKTRLFNTSYVLEEWKHHIDLKVKSKIKCDEVYNMLEGLLIEIDLASFVISLDETMKFISEADTSEFAQYFEEHFVRNEKYKFWAFCYCVSIGVNPNMSLNNFNWLLTWLNLQGDNVKPLKVTLCAVLNLLKDKLINLMIKLKKKTFLHNLRFLRNRHLESLKFGVENVKRYQDSWHVKIPRRKCHFVVKRVGTCLYCKQLMCTLCNVCFHEYVCTCKDKKMCKHIHLVARSMKTGEKPFNEFCVNKNSLDVVDDEGNVIKYISSNNVEVCEEDYAVAMNNDFDIDNNKQIIEEIFSVSDTLFENEQDLSLEEQKIKMFQELENLNSLLQKNVTIEQVDYVRREIKHIMDTVNAIKPAC